MSATSRIKVSGVTDHATSNLLLRSLSREGATRLAPHLRVEEVQAGQVLHHPGERIEHIYFPEDCVVVMLSIMDDGASIESATVGREGASWISASFNSPSMPCQTMVAIPGSVHKLPTSIVEEEVGRNKTFHDKLTLYSHALLVSALRSTACNGLHSIEQRCCRWLLTTLDRTDTEKFEITHDFLSQLLGVRRAGISQVVERLAEAGTLELTRGFIRVKSRAALEKLTCECYFNIREQYAKLHLEP